MKRISVILLWTAPLAALLLPLWPLLASDRFALLYQDLGSLVLLKKQIWRESVLQFGQLPLWNHRVLGGTPYLADPASGAFSPLNLVFLPFSSVPYALSWLIALSLALLFLTSFALFRRSSLEKGRALLLAVLFALGGCAYSYAYVPDYIGSAVGVALFLLGWSRFCREGGTRWLFLSSLALALPAYSSDPQASYLCAVFFAPTLLWAEGASRRKLLAWPVLAGLALLAFAPQLVPALDQLAGSVRDPRAGPIAEFQAWSLHPVRLREWISALPFGTEIFGEAPIVPYTNGPNPAPFLFSIYAGALFLPLLLAALPAARASRAARAWLALGAWLLLLAFGDFSYLPLNAWLGKILPLWSSFRYPERLLIYSLLAFFLGIAQAWAERPAAFERRLRYLAPAGALLAGLQLLGFAGTATGGAVTTALFGAAIAALLWAEHLRPGMLWIPAVALLSALDLSLTNARILFPVPSLVATRAYSPYARELARLPAPPLPERFFADDETSLNWEVLNRQGAGLPIQARLTLHQFLNLQLNIAPYLGFPASFGFATVMAPQQQKLWDALAGPQFLRLLGLKGTRYLGRREENRYSLSTLRETIPYFWFPGAAWFSDGNDLSLRLLASPAWPWTERLLVQPGSAPLEPFPPSLRKAAQPELRITHRSYAGLRMEIRPRASLEPGWLLWNESYAPNWRASLDGRELPTAIGNFWATAIRLPALESGRTYELALRYDDPLLRLGAALFLLWGLLFVWAEYRGRYRLPLDKKQA